MIGHELELCTGPELVRFVRALGQHRYVGSRLHLLHAFAVDAAAGDAPGPAIATAAGWARRALGSGVIELDSKDERLYRRATDAEVVAVLEAFWGAPDGSTPASSLEAARERLREHLRSIRVEVAPEQLPFDEAVEEAIFPVLIDAGWELLPLAHLDLDRHKGAIQSFDDFEVARFEEESAIPAIATLHELPVLGAVELLQAFDETGLTRAPFVLWQQGHETYLDYVLRGVLRAAKLD